MKITNMEPELIASGKVVIRTAVQKFMDTGQYEKEDVPALNTAIKMIRNPKATLALVRADADGITMGLAQSNGYARRWVESYDGHDYVRYTDGSWTLLKEIAGICPVSVGCAMNADTSFSVTAWARPTAREEDDPFVVTAGDFQTAVARLFLLVFAEALEKRLAQGERDESNV